MHFQERKIRLQKVKDAGIHEEIKRTHSTSRGQERNREEEMPNKRYQFCQREMYTATKKKNQTKNNSTKIHPIERKWKTAEEIKGHTFAKRFFVL